MNKVSIFGFFTLILVIVAIIATRSPEEVGQVPKVEAALRNDQISIKAQASRPVHITPRRSARGEANLAEEVTPFSASNLPSECHSDAITSDLLEIDFEDLAVSLASLNESAKDCISKLGAPAECFNIADDSDASDNCENNLLIARSRIIAELTQGASMNSLDDTVIANRIIAKIYDSEQSPDENGEEVFKLASQMLSNHSNNQEIHNIVAYFAVQSLKLKFEDTTLQKGNESAVFLAQSRDPSAFQLGLFYQFGYAVFDFVIAGNESSLVEAEVFAKEYLDRFSSDSEGYHMMGTIEGYRGRLAESKKWFEKGIEVGGPNQAGIEDYKQIVQSIQEGRLNRLQLGVRVDPSRSFNPKSILGL